ncbi:hypothetical protein GIB67_015348, partial [Kingdonia uniflora]
LYPVLKWLVDGENANSVLNACYSRSFLCCFFMVTLPSQYGFMFGRESALKDLGTLIDDLRNSNSSNNAPP